MTRPADEQSGHRDHLSEAVDQDRRHDRAATPGAVDARFTLAAERTVLAWIRTALGLIAAGVAVLHLVDSFDGRGVREGLGITLIATGALTALVGGRRWHRTTVALRNGEPMPGGGGVWSLIVVVVVLACVFAATSVGIRVT